MTALYLVNPAAGRGRGSQLADELPAMLSRHGLSGEVRQTSAPRDAIRLAREAAEAGTELVVAVGGDGTAHEVVNGIAGTKASFGLVPFGSGNDLALSLDIPAVPDEALAVIAAGHERRIDLGRFDDGWFANSLGLGFEAQVTIVSRDVRLLRGPLIYVWAALKAVLGLRCPDARLREDERETAGRRLLVCVGNGPRVGGAFWLTPDADNADGQLDLCVVEEMGRGPVLATLPKALSGTHTGHPKITMSRAKRIEIRSEDGFPFHADGEVYDTCRHELTIEVHPGALPVRAPPRNA